MTWYAIRTLPGAQMPQREYEVEATTIRRDKEGRQINKGYRIVPSLNPNVSAVERALSDAGFNHYMPVCKRLVRDRRKADLWKPRRFAMLLGYMFVENVTDFRALEETPGVAGVVRNAGVPMPIDPEDIQALLDEEMKAEERLAKDLLARKERAERLTRNRAQKRFPKDGVVEIDSGPFEGMSGTIVGTDRDGKIRTILHKLNSASAVSLPVNIIRLVA